MRAQEEMKLRREDARKLKRLQEENLPAYLKQLKEKNKLDTLQKRHKLSLPTPALQEHELEEIVRLGAQAMEEGGGGFLPTDTLLANSSVAASSTPLTQSLTGGTTSRGTPRREDTILMEAANAYMTISQQTPLEGGENLPLHATDLSSRRNLLLSKGGGNSTEGAHADGAPRTPNVLAESILKRIGTSGRDGSGATPLGSSSVLARLTGGAAGAAGGGGTPRLLMSGRAAGGGPEGTEVEASDLSVAESGGMGEKARLALARLQVRSSLSTLPAPQNEVEPSLPSPQDLAEASMDDQQNLIEEDMEEILKRRREAAEAARIAEWQRQAQAVQRSLPRPYLLPSFSFEGGEHAPSSTALPSFYSDEATLQRHILQIFEKEEEEDEDEDQEEERKKTKKKKSTAAMELAKGLKEAERLINEEMKSLDFLRHLS
ncbi:myb-like dna-binding domain-containing, partial [Cystoisospora suis]